MDGLCALIVAVLNVRAYGRTVETRSKRAIPPGQMVLEVGE